jgi:plastocyanin
MRNTIGSISAVAALVACLGAGASPSPSVATTAVAIADYSFKPPTITIAAGTRVVWSQKDDDPHTVTADDGSFDSKGLGQGDTYVHVFAKPGRYPYHCSAHPFMKGVVIVTRGKTP